MAPGFRESGTSLVVCARAVVDSGYFAIPPNQHLIYFLPLFLMPWVPVFKGPFPPALAAISLRAFSSIFVY